MRYLSNAFALSMVDGDGDYQIWVRPIEPDTIKKHFSVMPWQSAMGHADIARVVGLDIGVDVPVNRVSLKIDPQDYLYVAQYMGPRLPEGSTELPKGAEIKYFLVTFSHGLTAHYESFHESSIYGALYKRALEIAEFVGGHVTIKKDAYDNVVFVIDGAGFHAELRDE